MGGGGGLGQTIGVCSRWGWWRENNRNVVVVVKEKNAVCCWRWWWWRQNNKNVVVVVVAVDVKEYT